MGAYFSAFFISSDYSYVSSAVCANYSVQVVNWGLAGEGDSMMGIATLCPASDFFFHFCKVGGSLRSSRPEYADQYSDHGQSVTSSFRILQLL